MSSSAVVICSARTSPVHWIILVCYSAMLEVDFSRQMQLLYSFFVGSVIIFWFYMQLNRKGYQYSWVYYRNHIQVTIYKSRVNTDKYTSVSVNICDSVYMYLGALLTMFKAVQLSIEYFPSAVLSIFLILRADQIENLCHHQRL